jgi:hypothetical protein
MAGTCTSPSWSDLPIDVLLLILQRLELPQSLAFASVCTTWRAAAMTAGVPRSCTPLILSWAHLQKTLEQGKCSSAVTCNLYHLLDGNKACGVSFPRGCFTACCGASHGWLVLVNELSNLVLYNPSPRALSLCHQSRISHAWKQSTVAEGVWKVTILERVEESMVQMN